MKNQVLSAVQEWYSWRERGLTSVSYTHLGTAYAVWTGIGALGTFLVGILWFGDSSNVWRMLAATFLLIGIIGLKLAPGH